MHSVILVDDDRWARASIHALIEEMDCGFQVAEEFENATDALLWMHGHHADLIITDICMARVSGLEMIKTAREQKVNSLFVIISGYDDFSYIQEAFMHQVFYYMLKPVKDEELHMMLERASARLTEEQQHLTTSGYTSGHDLISQVKNYICEHFAEEATLEDIANHFHVNSSYLSSTFSRKCGTTLSTYRNTIRIEQAKELLRQGTLTVSEIAYTIGFNNPPYFNRIFKEITGMTPVQYQMQKTDRSTEKI